jgi:hypothetical protein
MTDICLAHPVIRNSLDLPSSRHFSPHMPRSSWTPAVPPKPYLYRLLCVGFLFVNTIAICPAVFTLLSINEAISSFREYGLPYGLRGSRCTLQLFRSTIFCLLHNYNTRFGWLVRPCPARTFTLQEMPSFAWRTNGSRFSRREGAGWRLRYKTN